MSMWNWVSSFSGVRGGLAEQRGRTCSFVMVRPVQ